MEGCKPRFSNPLVIAAQREDLGPARLGVTYNSGVETAGPEEMVAETEWRLFLGIDRALMDTMGLLVSEETPECTCNLEINVVSEVPPGLG